ncbi:unknown [Bacteroides sp. CAG:189]|nr:unknown [Bacteroides sp. CAG:189]
MELKLLDDQIVMFVSDISITSPLGIDNLSDKILKSHAVSLSFFFSEVKKSHNYCLLSNTVLPFLCTVHLEFLECSHSLIYFCCS